MVCQPHYAFFFNVRRVGFSESLHVTIVTVTLRNHPFYVHSKDKSLLHCNNNSISCILVKPSPALEALGHGHLLGLAYDRKTWAYPVSTVLATVAFLLILHTSLLSQVGITHYSHRLTLQHSTKLLFIYLFFLSRPKLIFKVPTRYRQATS